MLLEAVLGTTMTRGNLADSIREFIVDGLPQKAYQVHREASRRYPIIGVPKLYTVQSKSADTQYAQIKKTLEGIHGEGVEVDSYTIGFPTPENFAYEYLVNNFDMDIETGNIPVPIVEGQTGTQTYEDAYFEENSLRIVYDLNGEQKSIVRPIIQNMLEQIYIQSVYSLDSEPDKLRVWNYNTNTNAHPDLDINRQEVQEDYYPVIPVRSDYQSITENHPKRKAAERLLNILQINIDDVLESLGGDGSNAEGSGGRGGGDIPPGDDHQIIRSVSAAATLHNEDDDNIPEQIQDCFISFQADVNSKDPYVHDYLFRHFKNEAQLQDRTISEYFRNFDPNSNSRAPQQFPHTLQFRGQDLNKVVLYNYIDVEETEGSIGKVGFIVKEIEVKPKYAWRSRSNRFKLELLSMSNLIIKKQVSETVYETVTVNGLTIIEDIHSRVDVVRYIEDLEEEDDLDGLTILVSKTLLDKIPNFFTRAQILEATITATVYAVDRQKVKWYQRAAFGKLIQIAAIIWTIITYGAGSYALTWAAAVQVAKQVVIGIVISMAIQFGLGLIVDLIGADAAFILAMVASVVAIYGGGLTTTPDLPWAGDLLFVSSMSFNVIEQRVGIDLQRELDEHNQFMEDIEARYDELDAVNDMLKGDNPSLIDSVMRIQRIAAWETPEMFYSRTLNANPGVAVKDAISVYVERKLQLPTPEDLIFKLA